MELSSVLNISNEIPSCVNAETTSPSLSTRQQSLILETISQKQSRESPITRYLKDLKILDSRGDFFPFASFVELSQNVSEAFNTLYFFKGAQKEEDLETSSSEIIFEGFLDCLKEAEKWHWEDPTILELGRIREASYSKQDKIDKSLRILKESSKNTPYREVLRRSLKHFFKNPIHFEEAFLRKHPSLWDPIREKCFGMLGVKWQESESVFDQWETKSDLESFFEDSLRESFQELGLNSDINSLQELIPNEEEKILGFDFYLELCEERIQNILRGEDAFSRMKSIMNAFIIEVFVFFPFADEYSLTSYERYFLAKKTFKITYEELKLEISLLKTPDLNYQKLAEEAYLKRNAKSLLQISKEVSYLSYLEALEEYSPKYNMQPLRDLQDQLKNFPIFERIEKTVSYLIEHKEEVFSKKLRLKLKDLNALEEPDIEEIEEAISIPKTPLEIAEAIKPLLFKDQITYLTTLLEEPNFEDCLGFLTRGEDSDSLWAAYEIFKKIAEKESEDGSLEKTHRLFARQFLDSELTWTIGFTQLTELSDLFERMKETPLKRFLENKGIIKYNKVIENSSYLDIVRNVGSYIELFKNRLLQEAERLKEPPKELSTIEEIAAYSEIIAYQKFLVCLKLFEKNEDPSIKELQSKLVSLEENREAVLEELKKLPPSRPIELLRKCLEDPLSEIPLGKKIDNLFPWVKLKNPDSLMEYFFEQMGVVWQNTLSWDKNCIQKKRMVKVFVDLIKEECKEKAQDLDEALKNQDLAQLDVLSLGVSKELLLKKSKEKIDLQFSWFLRQPFKNFLGIPEEEWSLENSYYEKQITLDKAFSSFYCLLKEKIRKTDNSFFCVLLEESIINFNLTALDWIFKEVSYKGYLVLVKEKNDRRALELAKLVDDVSIEDKTRRTQEHLEKTCSVYERSSLDQLVCFPSERENFEMSQEEATLEDRFDGYLRFLKTSKVEASFKNQMRPKGVKAGDFLRKVDYLSKDYEQFIGKLRWQVSLLNKPFLEEELSHLSAFNFIKLDFIADVVKREAFDLEELTSKGLLWAAGKLLQETPSSPEMYARFLRSLEKISTFSNQISFLSILQEKELNDYLSYAMKEGSLKVKQALFESLKELMETENFAKEEWFSRFFLDTCLLYKGDSKQLLEKLKQAKEFLAPTLQWIKENGFTSSLSPFFIREKILDEEGDLIPFLSYYAGEKKLTSHLSFIRSALQKEGADFAQLDESLQNGERDLLGLEMFSWYRVSRPNSSLHKYFNELGVKPLDGLSPPKHYEYFHCLFEDFVLSLRENLHFLKKERLNGNLKSALYVEVLDTAERNLEKGLRERNYDLISELADQLILLKVQFTTDEMEKEGRQNRSIIKKIGKILTSKAEKPLPDVLIERIKELLVEHPNEKLTQVVNQPDTSEFRSDLFKYNEVFFNKKLDSNTSTYQLYSVLHTELSRFCIKLAADTRLLKMNPCYRKFLGISVLTNGFEAIEWIAKEVAYARYLNFLKEKKADYPDLVKELYSLDRKMQDMSVENKIEKVKVYLNENKDKFESIFENIILNLNVFAF